MKTSIFIAALQPLLHYVAVSSPCQISCKSPSTLVLSTGMRICFLSLHDHGHYNWAEEDILFNFINGQASGGDLSVKEVPWASAAELPF